MSAHLYTFEEVKSNAVPRRAPTSRATLGLSPMTASGVGEAGGDAAAGAGLGEGGGGGWDWETGAGGGGGLGDGGGEGRSIWGEDMGGDVAGEIAGDGPGEGGAAAAGSPASPSFGSLVVGGTSHPVSPVWSRG